MLMQSAPDRFTVHMQKDEAARLGHNMTIRGGYLPQTSGAPPLIDHETSIVALESGVGMAISSVERDTN